VDPGRVVGHHAGGDGAVESACEAAEDSTELGRAEAAVLSRPDIAVGLTASGRTPYVRGVLETARRVGALAVLVTANPQAPLADLADIHIGADTGPEALAGSTRLKAGTAQKLVLNAFSTALMVRLGKTYSNLMIDVVAANGKLRGRVLTVLEEATGADEDRCRAALAAADGDTKTALVCLLSGRDAAAARAALDRCNGVARAALADLESPRPSEV
ncbi:MAG: N-acetylmuramic acid 6-phosphate etherase, partial [Euzebyales bacterium]|nr:N-acetylmuramic acid 6-phosphate etherase [Euzebyales bacterium]MBA3621273.1 N-acetylmuramic acid 6-phosphate etherase [Euzebyales bacterium]